MANTQNLTQKGKGRPPGAQNKVTRALKDMVLESLERVGGVDYLVTLALENKPAYSTLIGKVLPLEIKAEHSGGTDNSLTVNFVKGNDNAG